MYRERLSLSVIKRRSVIFDVQSALLSSFHRSCEFIWTCVLLTVVRPGPGKPLGSLIQETPDWAKVVWFFLLRCPFWDEKGVCLLDTVHDAKCEGIYGRLPTMVGIWLPRKLLNSRRANLWKKRRILLFRMLIGRWKMQWTPRTPWWILPRVLHLDRIVWWIQQSTRWMPICPVEWLVGFSNLLGLMYVWDQLKNCPAE